MIDDSTSVVECAAVGYWVAVKGCTSVVVDSTTIGATLTSDGNYTAIVVDYTIIDSVATVTTITKGI
jgi:hypothetical protein